MRCRLLWLVPAGETPPRGYGRAWFDFEAGQIVAAPLGLNWLFGWLRGAYLKLRRGPSQPLNSEQALHEARGLAETAAVLAAVCERRHTLERVQREYAARN
jgi:hypothetical protein